MVALVTFAVTAWFLGLRVGGYAGGVSFASLVAAQIIPGTALVIYIAHVLWIGGVVYAGPKFARAGRRAGDGQALAQARKWWMRARSLGETWWRSRK